MTVFLVFFSVLYLPHPSSKWLHHIYTTQLGRFLEKADFTPDVREACQDLVSTAMGLYFNLSANLLPTPAKSHYTFNLRDLNKVSELNIICFFAIGRFSCCNSSRNLTPRSWVIFFNYIVFCSGNRRLTSGPPIRNHVT